MREGTAKEIKFESIDNLFGIPNDIAMQVVGVGFIIGVIQDSVETALNSSSDLLLSASAEFRQWRKEGKEIRF